MPVLTAEQQHVVAVVAKAAAEHLKAAGHAHRLVGMTEAEWFAFITEACRACDQAWRDLA